jgi:hypothetical protein
MKKISVLAVLTLFVTAGFAQKYEDIKNLLILNQVSKAKEMLDKKEGDAKFYSKPEGSLVKSSILGSLALDEKLAADADKNREEGYTSFLKYKEMDPSLKLLDDQPYRNAPYCLYASYFNSGVADINTKKYETSYEKFKKVIDLSDILIAKKIVSFTTDTNALYYAGILAETTKHPDDAVKYNTRLADIKIPGANYESVYQSLVRYYALKNDDANFEKYKAIGKSLYPKSEFFTYSKLDFAVGASENFTQKISNLEKIIAANPNDYTSNLALGEAIFDTLNSKKEGSVLPANFDELEGKMLAVLNKASSISPNELQPILLLGDHFTSKSDRVREQMLPLETEIDKKGAKATAADKQKFAEAKKKYGVIYDQAKNYYEKAADMFSKKGTLDANQKRQYRIIVGNLAQYYSYKREGAKGAEFNKIVAMETKYNNLYDQLRK